MQSQHVVGKNTVDVSSRAPFRTNYDLRYLQEILLLNVVISVIDSFFWCLRYLLSILQIICCDSSAAPLVMSESSRPEQSCKILCVSRI